jgi:hypothetical protein
MDSPTSESASVGLCFSCRHMRPVRTDRGSVFYKCRLAVTDPRYAQYPRLPVLRCPGYEVKEESPKSPA